ncbi:MAG: VOC family protein [Chloroflexota bacterium]
MTVLGIHHAGVTVGDIERALGFYRDLLGLELQVMVDRDEASIGEIVGFPNAHLRIAYLTVPGQATRLEILQYIRPVGTPIAFQTCDPGTGHVCFAVDGIHAIAERLRAAGVVMRSEHPVKIVQGPNRGAYALYVRDPDGNAVELIQPPAAT